MPARDCLIHLPGNTPVREVSRGRRAQFRDVESFGEVHFEEGARACTQRQNVARLILQAELFKMNERFMCLGHGSVILAQEAGLGETFRNFVAVNIGERLQDLDAAAMAMHVAEAADVHEDVEAEAMTGAEGPKEFVVASAMLRAKGDDP